MIIFLYVIIAVLLLSSARSLTIKWIVGCLGHEGKARIDKRSIYPIEVEIRVFIGVTFQKLADNPYNYPALFLFTGGSIPYFKFRLKAMIRLSDRVGIISMFFPGI